MARLTGKVALISGGARGMGAAHARRFVAEGARVVLGDVLDDDGKALAAELGESAHYEHLDVREPEQWRAAVAAATERFGGLHVLVNNAGIVNGNLLVDFALEEWQRIIDINLTGTFLGMQAATPALIAAGGGSVVNISSVEGMRGSPGLHGYTATKFAVRGLTKSTALELAPHNIRVNSVHPGLISTPMTEGIPADFLQIPLGRAAQPDEVSNLVAHLASDESSYCTGAEFVIDGGLTAGVPHKSF
ncbi:glucose 1-dehydrogenase [Nocardia puris]|uniref:3alpha(Or 20beta)-hydroxysteroid dehydrogenase n=1 Tax=Nocardia puris TaxID=208602 RepID=A0A366DFL9_9NOCA|nr:glucose 1-dehydrogenase [Nocardia puris]MBF6215043.1 glucose 1-dehydrogenase [Nocardia puris]MBF6367190.1 glucose 1-dehydrogenase [Nocardia puris]MBF6461833.1 glucose 1-dehydrogenase [Nocardia puris]RBO88289.1 3alpha(or 20beta)-hydroxysteroid dehydrogenase [Nocardia puris]